MPCERVLVIGLDGATFDVLCPLADRGLLPNLKRLMADSALAELTSTQPCITPAAWTTFQTGCEPHEHAILDYRYLDHRQRRLRLNDTARFRRPTLFHAVAAAGGAVVSLNLPMTWPAPAGVPGIVVGGLDSPSIDAVLRPYPRFAAELHSSGVRYDLATIWRRAPRDFDELHHGVEQTRVAFHGRAAAARIADRQVDWRLMVAQFQTLDSLQHRCWHLLGIDPQTDAPDDWVHETHRALAALDEAAGELLELAERRGAAVVVASDHGFGPFRGKIVLPEMLWRHGLYRPAPWTQAARFAAERARLTAGKWLRRRAGGGSTAAVSRGAAGVLPVDWRRSAAVALHGDLGAMIYLNRPERVGAGPLTTPRLVEQAQADVLAALGAARHPETDEPLFVDAWPTAARLHGDPIEQDWPDVVAIPAAGFHTRTKPGPRGAWLMSDRDLTGTHRMEGVLMVRAPSVRTGQQYVAHLRDAAPTILRLLGIDPPATMTGRPLTEMLTVATARGTVASAPPSTAGTAPALSAAEQTIVESRLRDLGYLD